MRWMAQDTETKISVSGETWQRLNARKREPGETFDDVVQRLLNDSD
jgi:predicted CopG family antitoxin